MYIASASSTVKFHNFPSYQLVHTYQPKYTVEGPCRSLSWTKNDNWLAVVPYTGCTEIVSLKDQCKIIHTVQDIPEPSCASFQNLTKRNIVIGTKQGQLLLYDIKMKSVKARYPKMKGSITHVGFTAKDTHCYAGCSNGDILLFNNVAKNLSCALRVPKSDSSASSVTDVQAHSLKRNFIMAGSNDGIICVWDVNVNKVKFKADAHTAPVSSVLFHPQNVMLVVSAGSDRSVRIFDIESHTRVNKIAVENNVLSIDFLDDSQYLVMGTQNGKIHIYDTRSLKEPVNSLDAHTSAVKHLLCQNSSESGVATNNSLSSVVPDDASQPSKSTEELPLITRKKRTSDVFGLLVQGHSSANATPELPKKSYKASFDCGDSFLNALGLEKNATLESDVFSDEGDCNKLMPKKHSLMFEAGNTPKTLQVDSKVNAKTTSTPYENTDDACFNNASPILNCASTSVTQIQNVNSEFIKTEMKQSMEQLETKLSYQFMDHAHQIRKMILDLHMAMMKEFIKVEDRFLLIREDMAFIGAASGDALIEENMNLKLKVEQLESELARLKVKDPNANT